MSTHDLRKKYLEFYQSHGHEILPSGSLLPENDPTTLFTGSGMQPMVPYLLGEKHPKGTRLTDSQKCFRAQDIDEVGDNRHTTFFEMLGNWSLGDYFKAEQITWLWQFLTDEVGLDPRRLYVTCFRGNPELGIGKDDEAAGLWHDLFEQKGVDTSVVDFPERDGMQGGRIFYYDEKKNWWSRSGVPGNMPLGEPGGPDSEVFWDFGAELGLHEKWQNEPPERFQNMRERRATEPCHVNCDCGRFLEIANSVFMQYKKTENGFEVLPQKNVDFGGGLERIAAAKLDNPDVFMIDLFDTARRFLEQASQKTYGVGVQETQAFRVILDHLRAATFLIGDGILPSNKDQGYFTRRLIRRAVRFAQVLGIDHVFAGEVAKSIINTYDEAYPDLRKKETEIILQIEKEEKKFEQTLAQGIKKFEEIVREMKKSEAWQTISGVDAFDLYQSYGFPIELTEELAKEQEIKLDMVAFEEEKKKHQEVSRQGADKKFKGGLADHSEMSVKYHTATHLLHIALRRVLGEHVQQKGSNITPERLRFDFSHPEKMTGEQLKQVEDLVNASVQKDYPVTWQEVPVEEAYKQNVIGFFPDRYDDIVKVYTVGDPAYPGNADPSTPTFSREICGGPHVEHTGVLGHFKITKEESLGTGLRRIKAILE